MQNLLETRYLIIYEILLERSFYLDRVHHIFNMDYLLLEIMGQLLHGFFELLLGCLDLLLIDIAKYVAELRDYNIFIDSAEELAHV